MLVTLFDYVFRSDSLFFQMADEAARKASEEVRSFRQSNEKFQARISEMHKARERMNSEHAIAVEKAKSEVATGGASGELLKKHEQELTTLRAQLTAQHEAALKAAVDAATAAAKAEVAVTSTSDESTQAAIAAAIAAHDAELQARHAADLDAAVESGRREQQTKSKIKDAQLVRAQNRLKDLEAQIVGWREAGLIPEATTSTAPPKASTSIAPALATASTPSTSHPAVTPTPSAATPSAPLVKPTPSAPASQPAGPSGEKQPTSGAVPLGVAGSARGRGRGVPRGAPRGLAIRDAARGRGGAPSPVATTSATAGVSIIGAATKRGREEETADDSLAKRMKSASETTGTVKPPPPVTLRRPPPPS